MGEWWKCPAAASASIAASLLAPCVSRLYQGKSRRLALARTGNLRSELYWRRPIFPGKPLQGSVALSSQLNAIASIEDH